MYLLWLHTENNNNNNNSNLVIFAQPYSTWKHYFIFFHFKKDTLLPISKVNHTQIKGHNNIWKQTCRVWILPKIGYRFETPSISFVNTCLTSPNWSNIHFGKKQIDTLLIFPIVKTCISSKLIISKSPKPHLSQYV